MISNIFTRVAVGLTLVAFLGCAPRVNAPTSPVKAIAPTEEAVPAEEEAKVPEKEEVKETELNIPLKEEEIKTKNTTTLKIKTPYSNEDIRLAKSMFKWKNRMDQGIWRECGKRYTPEEMKTAALEWASAINKAYKKTAYSLRSGKTIKVNKEEAMGLMMHESRFDRCAVGPYPRKFAYKNKLLKRKGSSLSHSLSELKKVFTNRKFQGRLADLGPGQIVKKIGSEYIDWDTTKKYLSIDPGVELVFNEMARRGEQYSTRTPSNRWPGSRKNQWYTIKVLRWAKYIFTDAYYR